MSVDSPAGRAETRTHWRGEGSKQDVKRVGEARRLLADLAEGYDKAASALRSCAAALETAKSHYSDGKAAERSPAALIGTEGTEGTAVTRTAQDRIGSDGYPRSVPFR
ncbi:hypothetical protein [Streptomyces sp. NRRL F-6491]|uniref:hypothetical protein n=1 Tax=Streptomyces sp. NRRL F-6491 TaxID=1519495 RepID=UPI00131C8795|nr:hypothetical protein [Streptomyces sp. NRRL F-6491]